MGALGGRVEAELDPRPGGRFRVRMHGGSVAQGEYVVVEPPERVVLTWGWEPAEELDDAQRGVPPGSTVVEIVLVADGEDTLIQLRQGRLPTDSARRFHAHGWSLGLGRLAESVGTAETERRAADQRA